MTSKLEGHMAREFRTSKTRERGLKHWATFIGEGGPRFYLGYSGPEAAPEFAILIASATDLESVKSMMPKIRQYIADEFPDASATIRLRAAGAAATAPVVFRLQADTVDALYSRAAEVKQKLRHTGQVRNVRDNWGQRIKKLVVQIDSARVQRAGLSNRDVANSLSTVLSGVRTTDYQEGDISIPIVLRSAASDREDISQLDAIKVYASDGTAVPPEAGRRRRTGLAARQDRAEKPAQDDGGPSGPARFDRGRGESHHGSLDQRAAQALGTACTVGARGRRPRGG